MIKVFEAFSGYGSQSIALERLGIEHKVVGISEIDKNAIKAYYALHSEDIPNLGDVSKINPEDLPEFDLFTYSFPCTDISLSGKVEGIVRGKTRSGLLYECERIIEYCKPKYLLMENVKNLVGKKFKPQFDDWLKYLESLGYSNQWFILNAKDFGVPQNRERVFCISVLDEEIDLKIEYKGDFLSLEDILETNVSENYKSKQQFENLPLKGNGASRGRLNEEKKWIQRLELRNDGLVNTLTSAKKDNIIIENGYARYLTERESFKLMGLYEEEIMKISQSGVSVNMQYKLAGNSIVIPVLMEIFRPLFEKE